MDKCKYEKGFAQNFIRSSKFLEGELQKFVA